MLYKIAFFMAVAFLDMAALEAAPLSSYIGMSLREAYEAEGVPDEVYVIRGDDEEADVVVNFYTKGLYFMWYNNRLHQVRVDKRYRGDVLGLFMGTTKEHVIDVLGTPLKQKDDEVTFRIAYTTYPIEARLFFQNNRLVDVYIYRSDI